MQSEKNVGREKAEGENDMHHINGRRNRSSGEGKRETAVLNQILLYNGSTVCQFPEHLSSAALPSSCSLIPAHHLYISLTLYHNPVLSHPFLLTLVLSCYMHVCKHLASVGHPVCCQAGSKDDA